MYGESGRTVLINNVEGEALCVLRTEFERYGPIRDVRRHGPEYVLVVYYHSCDAKKCLIHLSDHPVYKAREPLDIIRNGLDDLKRGAERASYMENPDSVCESLEKINLSNNNQGGRSLKKEQNIDDTIENNKEEINKGDGGTITDYAEGKKKRAVGRIFMEEDYSEKQWQLDCHMCRRPWPPGMEPPSLHKESTPPPCRGEKFISNNREAFKTPVALAHIQDIIDYDLIYSQPASRTELVLIFDFPLAFFQVDIYNLCLPFAKIKHIDIFNKRNLDETTHAYVYVATDEDANRLVVNLNGLKIGGKCLFVIKAVDFCPNIEEF